MQVLLFVSANLFPEGSPEGKAQPSTMKPMQRRRGICGSLGFQRVQGRESGLLDGEVGGVRLVVTGGGVGAAMSGEGERLCLGEREGQEEGSYRLSELTREKVQGWG